MSVPPGKRVLQVMVTGQWEAGVQLMYTRMSSNLTSCVLPCVPGKGTRLMRHIVGFIVIIESGGVCVIRCDVCVVMCVCNCVSTRCLLCVCVSSMS